MDVLVKKLIDSAQLNAVRQIVYFVRKFPAECARFDHTVYTSKKDASFCRVRISGFQEQTLLMRAAVGQFWRNKCYSAKFCSKSSICLGIETKKPVLLKKKKKNLLAPSFRIFYKVGHTCCQGTVTLTRVLSTINSRFQIKNYCKRHEFLVYTRKLITTLESNGPAILLTWRKLICDTLQ